MVLSMSAKGSDAVYVRGLIYLSMKRAQKLRRNSGRSQTMRVPVGEPHGFTLTGGNTMRCPISAWRAAMCSRARERRPGMPTRSSWRYGSLPTLIFLSSGSPGRSMRSY